jgi:hypothetical protein
VFLLPCEHCVLRNRSVPSICAVLCANIHLCRCWLMASLCWGTQCWVLLRCCWWRSQCVCPVCCLVGTSSRQSHRANGTGSTCRCVDGDGDGCVNEDGCMNEDGCVNEDDASSSAARGGWACSRQH